MTAFFHDLWRFDFLQYALLTGVLAAVASGVVGTYVVTRRIASIAGAISHCVLGGMGAAAWLSKVQGVTWIHPLHGAVVAAVAAALVIGLLAIRGREREDTTIGAVWAIGMAAGILFLARTPGYNEDLMSYLFGNILMVRREDLALILALDALVLGVAWLFYRPLLAVCFDEEYARLRGLRVDAYYVLLLCLTALTVVLLTTVVGIIMVIALLTLPIATAEKFGGRLWRIMVLSVLLTVIATTVGLGVSYGSDLPAGATIIMVCATFYGVAWLISAFRQKRAQSVESTPRPARPSPG